MKLTLRPEWRLWPFTSFLGILDIKTGVIVGLLFTVSPPVDDEVFNVVLTRSSSS